jgi:predicted transcriptional regulator
MIGITQYQKIQEYKELGLTRTKTSKVLGITYSSVCKYWNMSKEDYAKEVEQEKHHMDNYRQYILEQLKLCPQIRDTNIYLKLTEAFPDLQVKRATFYRYMKALASNALRYNNYGLDRKFDLKAYAELKQISCNICAPLISKIFEDIIQHKDDTDGNKKDILKSILMRLKNVASRGDAYLFQLMEMAEKLYQPFDADFLEVYGFSFSCCEKVFVYMYNRYIKQ